MIIESSYRGTYERIARARNGSLVRVHFAVFESNGTLKGRILFIEPVVELKKAESGRRKVENSNKFLSGYTKAAIKLAPKVIWYEQPKVSPYIGLEFFYS